MRQEGIDKSRRGIGIDHGRGRRVAPRGGDGGCRRRRGASNRWRRRSDWEPCNLGLVDNRRGQPGRGLGRRHSGRHGERCVRRGTQVHGRGRFGIGAQLIGLNLRHRRLLGRWNICRILINQPAQASGEGFRLMRQLGVAGRPLIKRATATHHVDDLSLQDGRRGQVHGRGRNRLQAGAGIILARRCSHLGGHRRFGVDRRQRGRTLNIGARRNAKRRKGGRQGQAPFQAQIRAKAGAPSGRFLIQSVHLVLGLMR